MNKNFNFTDGDHSLTVRSSDFDNNMSVFSDAVDLVVATAIPEPPIIISPINNTNITQATPVIIGVAAPLTMVEAVLDNKNILTSKVADDGSWQLAIPEHLVFG